MELTDDERKAIATLKRLAKRWPKTLWLFSASGTLTVMRYGPNGEQMIVGGHLSGNGCDPNYIVDTIDIPNDGGDW